MNDTNGSGINTSLSSATACRSSLAKRMLRQMPLTPSRVGRKILRLIRFYLPARQVKVLSLILYRTLYIALPPGQRKHSILSTVAAELNFLNGQCFFAELKGNFVRGAFIVRYFFGH